MDFEEIILDCLASSLTGDISINKLSKLLKEKGFSADYKNTYQKITKLEKQKNIITKSIGNSRSIKINYSNPQTIASLAKIELTKKIDFFDKNPQFIPINQEIEEIESTFISLINPQKNFNLNRIELLILTQDPLNAIKKCTQIEKKFSIKIDCLALKKTEYINLIQNNSLTISQMLSDKLILTNQETFFTISGKILNENNLTNKKYSIADLNENEIRYNLTKLGYSEFGKTNDSKELLPEETIASTLITGTARQKTALKEIITKNTPLPELLFFLTKKYSKQKELSKILQTSQPTNTDLKNLKQLLLLGGN